MVKNFPLLISMLLIGVVALVISQTIQLPEVAFWIVLVTSFVLNIWSLFALILHLWVKSIEQ